MKNQTLSENTNIDARPSTNVNQIASIETTKEVTGNRKWDTMYHHLVEYKNKHHDCLVPNRYKQMPQLGGWVSTQRRHYKLQQAGKDSPLTPQRLELLTNIGFVWATKDPRHVPWKQRFDELLDFKKKYGHCLIPVSHEENPQLANWVSTQRQEWKAYKSKRPSRLTEERVALLNNAGFVWEAQRGLKKRQKDSSNECTDVIGKKPFKISNECENSETHEEAEKAINKQKSSRPWISLFKDFLWHLDQNQSPEDVPSLKQWADEQRIEYHKQINVKSHGKVFEEGASKLTMDQYNLLQSINFNWKKVEIPHRTCTEPNGVEKCPSAESEIAVDQSAEKKANNTKKDRAAIISSHEVHIDAAETLFSMGAKTK